MSEVKKYALIDGRVCDTENPDENGEPQAVWIMDLCDMASEAEALRKRLEEAQALRSEVVGIIMSIEESGDWQCVVAHSTQIFRVDPTVGCALSPAENGPHLIGRKVVIADGCMIYNPLYMPSEGELTIEGGNDE